MAWRALFLSDLHLGTRLCRAAALAGFLRGVEIGTLYLVGDILDRARRPRWTEAQHHVLAEIEAARARGTRIIRLRGNHDGPETAPDPDEPPWPIEAVHETADGRRLLVTHGDRFDRAARLGLLAARLGGWSCDALQSASDRLDRGRLRSGRPALAAARRLKRRVKEVTRTRDRFATALAVEAARRGFDGVISGHIHLPELGMRGGVLYGNCGDWIDNCTAIGERADGALVLLHPLLERAPPRPSEAPAGFAPAAVPAGGQGA